jgi:ABC-type multidrug transport system fused ATPase/permease subunit
VRQILPVADGPAVRRYARDLLRRHPRQLKLALALHVSAAIAGLAAPRLLGNLVEAVQEGTTTSYVNTTVAVLAAFLLVQTVLTRYARFVSYTLAEEVLAELREDFVEQSLALPVGVVEKAGTGDLLTRTSRDVDALGWSVRFAVPEVMIAVITATFTLGACLLVGPWVGLACVLGVPVLWFGTKWYLKRAKDGYLREMASYAQMNASLAETVEGARTVEALALSDRRIRRIEDDVAESFKAERYTLFLRTGVVPDRRGWLPHPHRRDAAYRWLAARHRTRLTRRRHRRHAVRPAAHRPCRPADLLARRAADRRRLTRPAARRRARAGRPNADRAYAGR